MGPAGGASAGGELTGVSAVAWNEPAPYGMVLVKRGSLKIGPEKSDSLGVFLFLRKRSLLMLFGWMKQR